MHCISKYTINCIFSMILNFNQPTILMKPKNLQLLYISILKNKKASGHSHILLTSVRPCSSWLNSSWPGTHMLIRYGSMTPRGAHMRPLPSPLRAPLLLRKVVCNVHVATGATPAKNTANAAGALRNALTACNTLEGTKRFSGAVWISARNGQRTS